jgi:hypothetical protein
LRPLQKLTNDQFLPHKSTDFGGIAVFETLVFEFMGLAMIALCVIVLIVPPQRHPGRRATQR